MVGMFWALVLLAVGLAVMVLEVFVPSGGVLGFVSALALLAAVATAFVEQGVMAGFLLLAMTIVLVPVVLMVAFRWFPLTPLGRRVLPSPPDVGDVLPQQAARDAARRLVGTHGTVVDELVPWGTVRVGDRIHEAMSEGGVIGAGEPVDVVGTQGLSLIVRRREPPPVGKAPAETGSLRSETLEEFDFERLDPPSA